MSDAQPPPLPPPRRPAPSTGRLVIAGPIGDRDLRALCERLRAVITASDAYVIVCDVCALPADCRAIGVLARLQLTAHRSNRRICLQRASPELVQLLEFAGLADVVPAADGAGADARPARRGRDPPAANPG